MKASTDAGEDTSEIMRDFVILDANDVDSRLLKNLRALGVVIGLTAVNVTVHFNGKPLFMTVEVHDEPAKNLLTTELTPRALMRPKLLPQDLL